MINGSYPADILLDDIKIFNKTLSQQEIFYDMDPIGIYILFYFQFSTYQGFDY